MSASSQCPFCGGFNTDHGIANTRIRKIRHSIYCRDCGARGPLEDCADAALEAWERRCKRPPPDVLDGHEWWEWVCVVESANLGKPRWGVVGPNACLRFDSKKGPTVIFDTDGLATRVLFWAPYVHAAGIVVRTPSELRGLLERHAEMKEGER